MIEVLTWVCELCTHQNGDSETCNVCSSSRCTPCSMTDASNFELLDTSKVRAIPLASYSQEHRHRRSVEAQLVNPERPAVYSDQSTPHNPSTLAQNKRESTLTDHQSTVYLAQGFQRMNGYGMEIIRFFLEHYGLVMILRIGSSILVNAHSIFVMMC